jgi:hypothetical protein
MTPTNQVEYLIGTRQFSRAFELGLEILKNFKKGSVTAWDLESVAQLSLQIAVQYKEELSDVEKIILTIQENQEIPEYLKEKLGPWRASVRYWKSQPKGIENLDDVRILIKQRKSEIDDMRALSSLLQLLRQYLVGAELGESLYLIGKSYENLNFLGPMKLNENYFESCIRQLPHTDWSRKCYKSLEDSIRFGFSGSGGTHVPMGIQVQLDILKKEAE